MRNVMMGLCFRCEGNEPSGGGSGGGLSWISPKE